MNQKRHRLDHTPYLVAPGQKIRLKDYDPGFTAGFKNKAEGKAALLEDVSALAEAQELLWASAQHAVLIIFQALDAAGKDSTIKHVMSGVNPQGVQVHSFKAPSEEERRHHFLWRPMKALPACGRIAIFNRSYYEEALVVRVHPHFLEAQWLPQKLRDKNNKQFWKSRYSDINEFELIATRNDTTIIKFFLHVSKEEQRQRFLERLNEPEKQWKFSVSDYKERAYWDDYVTVYEDMLNATSTEWAPWYIIPADRKWFMRALVADIITARIEALNLAFPQVSQEQLSALEEVKQQLEQEGVQGDKVTR